jgi:YidC/Oxa1 family membrane protein insertase
MDRRTILALILTAVVIVATPMLFPTARRPQPSAVDSSRLPAFPEHAADTGRTTAASPSASAPASSSRIASAGARAETTVVTTNRAVYDIVSPGGVPARVRLPEYRALTRGARHDDRVDLLEPGDRLFTLRVVSGRDTIALDTVGFTSSGAHREGNDEVVTLRSVSLAAPVTLTYRFPADSFSFSVRGTVAVHDSGGARAGVLVTLPSRIRSQEADTLDDARHLAFGYKRGGRDAESIAFRDLDAATTRVDTGAFRWMAERNKYFAIAAIPSAPDTMFRALIVRGGPRSGKEAANAYGAAVLPFRGEFTMRVYAGPQSWEHLRRTAAGLENVNPYGGWLHAVVQPFATIVMRLLLWMRRTFKVEYGLVLVIFGVLVRLLLWPLNQNAMRSSMKMQRIQPELAELQKKYRNDPERQRDAMMKLYKDHGMSPFSPILGCLPMLLPMPILFALYFVFQNTIELRGVSFLWLPDLSLRDPFFITPLFMGASMFVLSWIGMRGMPPSPQSKMMSYVMPVMFTVLFWNFASGLNLYYAVQNIAAIPQQWLLARERVAQGRPPDRPDNPRARGTGRDTS